MPSRLPLVSVLFNLDAAIRSEELSAAGLRVHLRSNPRRYENFELFLNACQNEDEIILEAQYGTSLFERRNDGRWLELYANAAPRGRRAKSSGRRGTRADRWRPSAAATLQ